MKIHNAGALAPKNWTKKKPARVKWIKMVKPDGRIRKYQIWDHDDAEIDGHPAGSRPKYPSPKPRPGGSLGRFPA